MFSLELLKWRQGVRAVSLPLRLWFLAKMLAGGTLDSAVTGI